MKLVALIRARSEAWVLRYSARVALSWCDALVILDHASKDATPQIIAELTAEYSGRVVALREDDPDWREMAQMQRLLEAGREIGGTHFAIVDADEILTANLLGQARSAVSALQPCEMLMTPLHNLWRSLDTYREDASKHGKKWTYLVFADGESVCWPAREQFHHRYPKGVTYGDARWPAGRHLGGVMHLQRANWKRAQARQSRYKMLERVRWPDKMVAAIDHQYETALDERDAILEQVPDAWWAHGLDRSLIDLHSEPWEVAECESLLREHGPETFTGLRLAW